MDRRGQILEGIDVNNSVGVEIGAVCNPMLSQQEGSVAHVNYTEPQALREHKNDPHVVIDETVNVTAIWANHKLPSILGIGRKAVLESWRRMTDGVISEPTKIDEAP
jgi:hypothetical protein